MPQHEVSIRNYRPLDSEPYFGVVTMPLSSFSGEGAERTIEVTDVTRRDEPHAGNLTWQVDRIDPSNPSRDVLSLHFEYMRPGGLSGAEEAARLLVTTASETWQPPDTTLAETTHHYYLHGVVLEADIQFEHSLSWKRGAIDSVRLAKEEVLDAFQAQFGVHGHDKEKRIQLDRVSLPNPPFFPDPFYEVTLLDEPWTFVTGGRGNVRMFATLRSPEFDYRYIHSSYTCNLYRVISIHRHSDSIVEELYVRGRPSGGGEAVDLHFSPHYFLKMHFAKVSDARPARLQFLPQIPDWFSIASHEEPYPGYGFAASAPYKRIENPPLDHPDQAERNAFGWYLDLAKSFRCVHMFRRWGRPPRVVSDETGRRWYDFIYAPPAGFVVATITE
jgi:hypothetical protein